MKFLCVIPVLVISALFIMAYMSRNGSAAGLKDGQLKPCPSSPNCICTLYPYDQAHYYAPIKYPDFEDERDLLALIVKTLESQGGKLILQQQNYIVFTFSTKILGFIDDVEIYIDGEANFIHIRSASRIGRSDFDANLKRVKRLSQALKTRLATANTRI